MSLHFKMGKWRLKLTTLLPQQAEMDEKSSSLVER